MSTPPIIPIDPDTPEGRDLRDRLQPAIEEVEAAIEQRKTRQARRDDRAA